MAIDSREKRQAVASIHLTGWSPPSPTPNASKDKEWRQEAGWGYPGIVPQSSQPDVDDDHFRGFLQNPGKLLGTR